MLRALRGHVVVRTGADRGARRRHRRAPRSRTAKGVAGLDLTRLLVGSEGTLGVVTEATLCLAAPPPPSWTVAATFPSIAACGEAVVALRRAGLQLSLLELLDATTLRAIDDWRPTGLDPAEALLLAQVDRTESHPDTDGVTTFRAVAEGVAAVETMVAADEDEAAWLRGVRTMAYPAFERQGRVLHDDVCVPLRAMPALVTGIEEVAVEHDVVIGTFGHAGDGNLHPTIVVPPDGPDRAADAFAAIVGAAQRLGGICTGEHGVGTLKLPFLAAELDPEAMRLARQVKAVFDPAGRLNPGRGLG